MFIFKIHYEATKNNLNPEKVEQDWYQGRDSHLLSRNKFPTFDQIVGWGYKTKDSAKSAFENLKNECNEESKEGYWNVSCELIEML